MFFSFQIINSDFADSLLCPSTIMVHPLPIFCVCLLQFNIFSFFLLSLLLFSILTTFLHFVFIYKNKIWTMFQYQEKWGKLDGNFLHHWIPFCNVFCVCWIFFIILSSNQPTQKNTQKSEIHIPIWMELICVFFCLLVGWTTK